MPKSGFSPSTLLVKNSLWNLLGLASPLLVGIIAIPFAIKGLGKEGFGVLCIAWVVLGYFGLFDFGLSRAATKFVSEALRRKNDKELQSIVWAAILVSFGLGSLGAVLMVAVTPYLVGSFLRIPDILVSEAHTSFIFIACSLPVVLCSTSLRGILGGAQRFDLVNLILIPTSMSTFVFSGLSFPFHLSLAKVILLIILFRIGAGFCYLILCLKIFPVLRSKPTIDLKIFKKLLSYGAWVSVTNVISPLLVYMDRFFIGSLISMSSVTFYSAPLEMITRLRILPSSIMTTLFPEFSVSSNPDDKERIEILFVRSTKYIFMIVGALIVLLIVYAQPILEIWIGPEFVQNSLNVTRILAFAIFFNSIALVPYTLLQGVGRPDLPAKFHLGEFGLYFLLLIFLVKTYGIDGAAWAWAIRVLVDATLLFGAVFAYYPLLTHFRKNRFALAIPWLLLLWVSLHYSSVIFIGVVGKLFSLSVILFTFSVVGFFCVLDNDEKKFAISMISKLINHNTSKKNTSPFFIKR